MKRAILLLTVLLICFTAKTQTSFQDNDLNSAVINPLAKYNISNPPPHPMMISSDEKQIKKGDFILTGGASLYFSSYNYSSGGLTSDSKGISLGIYPGIYFFVTDGLAIGTSLSAGFYSGDGNFSYNLGLGPELRYYFNFGLFVNAGASYLLNHYDTYKYNTIEVESGVGYAIFLNPHVALEPCLFYNLSLGHNIYSETDSNSSSNKIGFKIGLSIFL